MDRAGWNLVVASVAGTAHRDGVCQDHADARLVDTADGPVLIAAVADGAGSASHADTGAQVAVAAFLDRVEAEVAGIGLEAITDEHVRGWVQAARVAVEQAAETAGVPPRQLACTLLGAVIGPDLAWFAQVGDGVIVCDDRTGGGYAFVFWPDAGEYANTTRFLTDADFPGPLRIDRLDEPIQALALLTDGLQRLALDYAAEAVHAQFFDPLFQVVARSTDPAALTASLRAFLDSPRVNARTDDDKTLILATRHHDHEPAA